MSQLWKKLIVCLFALPVLALGSARPLTAEIIGTLPALDAAQRDRDLDTVNRALASEQVRQQLTQLGRRAGPGRRPGRGAHRRRARMPWRRGWTRCRPAASASSV